MLSISGNVLGNAYQIGLRKWLEKLFRDGFGKWFIKKFGDWFGISLGNG